MKRQRIKRRLYRRFRTRWEPALFNPYMLDRTMTVERWDALGGFEGALRPGWRVQRSDWWERGSSTSVTAETRVEALRALDETQDAAWRASVIA